MPASGPVVPAVALNWATAAGGPLTVDLNGDGVWEEPEDLVDPGAALPNPIAIPITFRGDQLAVAGSITGLDLFGILTGGADFSVTSQLVDVDFDGDGDATTGDQLDDASLVTFALSNLNLRLGTPTVGLQIGPGGTIGIASISAPAPLTGTDTRSWTAVVGADLVVSLSLPGVTGSVENGSLKINRAAGELNGVLQTGADALDWATEDGDPLTVDLDADDPWTAPADLVDPGNALPTPVAMPVTLRGAQTAVAGELTNLNLFDFITGGANFALTSQAVDLDLDGDGNAATGEQLNDATLLTIALSDLTLFVGIDGAGLTVTGGSIGIAVLSAPAPLVGTDTRSWTAVSADDFGVALDLPGIEATVTSATLRIGRASGLKNGIAATPVNWVKADGTTNGLVDLNSAGAYTAGSDPVDPGEGLIPPVEMPVTQRGDSLAISGSLEELNIFDFISGDVNFAITRQAVDVDLDGDGDAATGVALQLDNAGLLTIALDQLDVTIGGGLSVTSGQLAIAILSAPVPASGTDDRDVDGGHRQGHRHRLRRRRHRRDRRPGLSAHQQGVGFRQ